MRLLGIFVVLAMLVCGVAEAQKRPLPSKQLERFLKMSPDERKKALSQLPPERRAAIERRLERYESLTPEQQERVNRRLDTFQSLPIGRRVAVRQELQRLRQMSFRERRDALNSEEERKKFSPEEYQLLRESFPRINAEQQE
jgi:hypothetical protein